MMQEIKLGMKFGRWTIIDYATRSKNGFKRFLCRCDCGYIGIVFYNGLSSGSSKSCGCLKAEVAKKLRTKHGCFRTRTYRIWQGMHKRCKDINCKEYIYYGGRGITVCERWNKFENFLADRGECPPGLTLERKDVNKNYDPDNCRWATQKEQQNNRRNNHWITFNGETKTLTQWADKLGCGSNTLLLRLKNWSLEKALTIPIRKRNDGPKNSVTSGSTKS